MGSSAMSLVFLCNSDTFDGLEVHMKEARQSENFFTNIDKTFNSNGTKGLHRTSGKFEKRTKNPVS